MRKISQFTTIAMTSLNVFEASLKRKKKKYFSQRLKNNVHPLSERLSSIGIMEAQLRASLKFLNTIVL